MPNAVAVSTLRAMTPADVDAVVAIEAGSYSHPWTRGNFIDTLAAGHHAQVLADSDGRVAGYVVAMAGVGEMHLLNITVAPDARGRGLARRMLDALDAHCRELGLATLWLEVRAGNAHARAIYARRGYAEVGLRRGYYPALNGQREDAVVMRADIDGVD